MRRNEEIEQTHLFTWAFYEAAAHPELKNLFAVPNGGLRSKTEAARLKAAGVKAGVPDIMLAVARSGFHGLFIELKVGKNKTSPLQDEWIERLMLAGYKCAVCYGFETAKYEIEKYLGIIRD